MLLLNLLSPYFISNTVGKIEGEKIYGLYSSNVNLRFHVLDSINRDKIKIDNMLMKFIKKYPEAHWRDDYLIVNPNFDIRYINMLESNGVYFEIDEDSLYHNISMTMSIREIERLHRDKIPIIFIKASTKKFDKFFIFEIPFAHLYLNPTITIDFILKYPDEDWYWEGLTYHRNINFNDILATPQLNWDLRLLSYNPTITIFDIENSDFDFDYRQLSSNTNVTIEYIKDNPDKNWYLPNILSNPNLTIEYVKEQWVNFTNQNDIIYSGMNPNITILDIVNNQDLDWNYIGVSQNPSITMEDIENNPNLSWNWFYVSRNPNFTLEFYEKYKDDKIRKDKFPNSKYRFSFHELSKNLFNKNFLY